MAPGRPSASAALAAVFACRLKDCACGLNRGPRAESQSSPAGEVVDVLSPLTGRAAPPPEPNPTTARLALNQAGLALTAALNAGFARFDDRAPFVELALVEAEVEWHGATAYVSAFDLLRLAANAVRFWERETAANP